MYFFGLKKNMDLISYANTVEFFIDVTFKIIPVQFRPHKLFIIAGINKTEKKPKLFSMILTKIYRYYVLFTYIRLFISKSWF